MASDPTYRTLIYPLVIELLEPQSDDRVLDLGCGEGTLLAELGTTVSFGVGCDHNLLLASRAAVRSPVVLADLSDLAWLDRNTFNAACMSMVANHLPDLTGLWEDLARVIVPGGRLVLVDNSPHFTAPGSAPIIDEEDELLWRWGEYLRSGQTTEIISGREVIFYHRPLSELLTQAGRFGWQLTRMVELPLSYDPNRMPVTIAAQQQIPRIVGFAWELG